MCLIRSDAVAKMRCHQFTVLWRLGVVEHPVLPSLRGRHISIRGFLFSCATSGSSLRRAYRDGVFGAGVDDRLQEVVKLCDVQLRFQQKLLVLLLHGQGNGSSHLFLRSETCQKENKTNLLSRIFKLRCHQRCSVCSAT